VKAEKLAFGLAGAAETLAIGYDSMTFDFAGWRNALAFTRFATVKSSEWISISAYTDSASGVLGNHVYKRC